MLKFLFLIILIPNSYAHLTDCGKYSLKGVIRTNKKEGNALLFITNEGSLSANYFNFAQNNDTAKAFLYLNKPITMDVLINKKMQATTGEIAKVLSINLRIENPLNPYSSQPQILETQICN